MTPPVSTRALLAAYQPCGWRTRAHVWGRWRSCPFTTLEGFVPRSGRLLDVGCGHGVFSNYLSMVSPDRTVLGLDIDADKLAIARGAAARVGTDTTFIEGSATALPPGPWDAVVVTDVLYLLAPEEIEATLHAAAASLAAGGRIVLKGTATEPRWKLRVTRAQEVLATRVLRITKGESLTFMPPEAMAEVLRSVGLHVEMHRLDRRSLYPHHLIVATNR